mgnify:CR=1 FL=1
MEKSNIKKLKKDLTDLLAKEKYKDKKFFAYDNYFDNQEASKASKINGFKCSNFVKNLPLSGKPVSSKEIIDLVCNYIEYWSDWEFTEVGSLKEMVIVHLKNGHNIEIITSFESLASKY